MIHFAPIGFEMPKVIRRSFYVFDVVDAEAACSVMPATVECRLFTEG